MTISPASELLEIVQRWRVLPNGQSPEDFRAGEAGWWKEHARAVALVDIVASQAQTLVDSHPEIELTLPVLDDVRRMIFCFGASFGTARSSSVRLFPETSIATFAGLAGAINGASLTRPTPEAAELLNAIGEVQLLIADLPIDEEVREYLAGLCEQLIEAIHRTAVDGGTDVRSMAFELFAALGFYAQSDESGNFRDAFNRFGKATARFIGIDLPVGILTALTADAVAGVITG